MTTPEPSSARLSLFEDKNTADNFIKIIDPQHRGHIFKTHETFNIKKNTLSMIHNSEQFILKLLTCRKASPLWVLSKGIYLASSGYEYFWYIIKNFLNKAV